MRVVAAFDCQQAVRIGTVCCVGLASLPGSDEVGVAAVEALWAELGIYGVGPVAVVAPFIGRVPRGDDLDDHVIRADAERRVAEWNSRCGAVEMVNGDAAERRAF